MKDYLELCKPRIALLNAITVFIGYWLAGVLGVAHTKGIDWIRWIISIGVAAILSFAFAAFTSRRRTAFGR